MIPCVRGVDYLGSHDWNITIRDILNVFSVNLNSTQLFVINLRLEYHHIELIK
jgi:hypothetical protein